MEFFDVISFISKCILLDLLFPGSAEADVK